LQLKFGYSISWSSLQEIISKSLEAEKFGFNSLWYSDHLIIPGSSPVLESFSVLTALAINTKYCKIGQPVVDTLRRHPATLAHATLTLNHISKGRAFLGLGAGEPMNLVPIGLDIKNPLKRLRESIQYVRGLFKATKDAPFNFAGDIFSANNVFLNVSKFNDQVPPIYVGALGSKTREIAGELADGWVPYVHSLSNYGKLLSDIQSGAKKTQRKLSDLDIVANIPILMMEKENSEKRRNVKKSLAIRLLLETNTLKDLGWNQEIPNEISQSHMIVSSSIARKLESEADKIPQEIAEQIAAIGTTSQIVEILEKYRKIGATHFLIKLLGKVTRNDLSKFKAQVIEVLKNT